MCLVWSHHMRTSAVLSRSPTTSLTYESNNPLLQYRRALKKTLAGCKHLGGSTVRTNISESALSEKLVDVRNTLARTTPLGVLRDWNKRQQSQVYGGDSSWLIARSPPRTFTPASVTNHTCTHAHHAAQPRKSYMCIWGGRGAKTHTYPRICVKYGLGM